ncbi:MAG: methylenetetrahydrofolate reductase [Actinomycetota bacterium]
MASVSFEYFPPATDAGIARLSSVATELDRFAPSFVSVTYGAGGSTQRRTIDTIEHLRTEVGSPVAGHITTVNATVADTHAVLDRYRALGVSEVVALRGDPPVDTDGSRTTATTGLDTPVQGYQTADALVAGIRSRPDGHEFTISVGAYPEIHPKATSAAADLDNLKRKIDAGADRAITQFFFDPEVYLRFRDAADTAGITAPIVPGIMPILDLDKIAGFAASCGATIPSALAEQFAGLDDDPDIRSLVAATAVSDLCHRLVAEGVDDLHFYTMNRRPLVETALRALGQGELLRSPR